MRKLGTLQTDMLINLGGHGGEWHHGSGWRWGDFGRDTAVYESLCKRGLVEAREAPSNKRALTGETIYRMTRAGREWYREQTGKPITRHRFAIFTEPYEEGETEISSEPAVNNVDEPEPDDMDFVVPENLVQGWTVADERDRNDRLIIGTHRVYWVVEHGYAEAKRRAEQYAKVLNERHQAVQNNVSAIAVPITVATIEPG